MQITAKLAEYIDTLMLALEITPAQRTWAAREINHFASNTTTRRALNAYWPQVIGQASWNSFVERAAA